MLVCGKSEGAGDRNQMYKSSLLDVNDIFCECICTDAGQSEILNSLV